MKEYIFEIISNPKFSLFARFYSVLDLTMVLLSILALILESDHSRIGDSLPIAYFVLETIFAIYFLIGIKNTHYKICY
jgi:hypothetical protein